MLTSAALEIEPGILPSLRKEYRDAFDRFSASMDQQYASHASLGLACLLAVNHWKELQPKYDPLELRDLVLHFSGKSVEEAYGRTVGQDILVIKNPNFRAILAVDVAAYLFGFGVDEVTAVIGNRPFIERIFTERYQPKFPGVQITIPGTQGF